MKKIFLTWIFLLAGLGIAQESDPSILILEGSLEDKISLSKDWRFANEYINKISDEQFDSLPTKNPFTGLLHYVSFTKSPHKGSYVLRVVSDRDRKLWFLIDGLLASSEIKLLHGNEVQIAYLSSNFYQDSLENTRLQIPNLVFSVMIPQGVSYLVYNYKQKPFEKSDGIWSNAGFFGQMNVGSHDQIKDLFSFREIMTLIPLGIFVALSIYSLLIYTSRRGEDYESLLIFFLNFSIFIKELSSQTLISRLFGVSQFAIEFSQLAVTGPLLTSLACYLFINHRAPHPLIKFIIRLQIILFSLNTLSYLGIQHVSWLPNTSNFYPLSVLVNIVSFYLVFLPYSFYAAYKYKKIQILYFVVGVSVLSACIIVDFLNASLNLGFPWMSMWGGSVLSVLLAKDNSLKFARAFEESVEFNLKLESSVLRQHKLLSELRKLIYPHQVEQISKQDKLLEETMPTETRNAVCLMFDIQASGEIGHSKNHRFFSAVIRKCHKIMTSNYNSEDMSSNAYMIKELGDGFLCSIGFPFTCEEDTRLLGYTIVKEFIKVFTEIVHEQFPNEDFFCSVGMAFGRVTGFFPHSGPKNFDLYGDAIVLAKRYEGARNLIFSSGVPKGNIIVLQKSVYEGLDPHIQKEFIEYPLINEHIRDDEEAQVLYYQILDLESSLHLNDAS